jgi:hypothetical protein
MMELLVVVHIKGLLTRLQTRTHRGMASFAIGGANIFLAHIEEAGCDCDLHLPGVVADLAVHALLDVVGGCAVAGLA